MSRLASGKHSNENRAGSGKEKHRRTGDDRAPKPPKSGKSVGSSSSSGQHSGVGFLFVVNEAVTFESADNADLMGNMMPPLNANGFGIETAGTVFRYRNGIVTPAQNFSWIREDPGEPGSICREEWGVDSENLPMRYFRAMTTYTTRTVFHCGPFAPHVFGVGDVSDATNQEFDRWHALHFQLEGGLTRVSPSGGMKYVASDRAAWLDRHQIISKIYKNPGPSPPDSIGLGGDIALVIGLIALSQDPGTIDNAFAQQLWTQGRWRGQKGGQAWPISAHETPRGVIVHIAHEPDGAPGQTAQDIYNFEWYGVSIWG